MEVLRENSASGTVFLMMVALHQDLARCVLSAALAFGRCVHELHSRCGSIFPLQFNNCAPRDQPATKGAIQRDVVFGCTMNLS